MVDSWSFTAAGRPWINHEWLADLIFEGWTRAFGRPALLWWKWGIALAIYLLLFHVLRRVTRSAPASWAGVLLGVALGETFLEIRPHLYTQLGYVLLLALALSRDRSSLWLPAVFLAWANLHGGVTFGLIALGVILAVSLLLREESLPRAAGLWTACVLAALVNPYGWNLLIYPFRYVFGSSSPYRATLREWLPLLSPLATPPSFSFLGIALFLAAVIVLFATGGVRRNPRAALTGLALSAFTLAMTLQSRRFIALFGISAALVVALALEPLARRLPVGLERATAVLALVLSLVWLVPGHPLRPLDELFPALTRMERFPVAACDFLKIRRITGNVFAAYTWGGYLPYCGADVRVYIDGRADTVYDDETYRRFARVLNRAPGWQEIVNASGADYFLWPRGFGTQIPDLVDSGRWRVVYGDSVAVLLARN